MAEVIRSNDGNGHYPAKPDLEQQQNETHVEDGLSRPNGWNGTFVKAKDPYALMRDCDSSSRQGALSYV